ncbi:NUDIX hydrolase [Leadbettera azotonutricia]|uniref:MutT/NUDIX family protein n=1 Tax=Leadbettera azotonutricia (strain ATCC BAA-888 / DSM 13862 / ZAS-9) TaxID=545695 RepID=F5YBA7_LEAAZ|nr:NUDIX domain-containing protein [Leadbettera azotonutricia]AEF80085.1 MutT/NUDIX family protein [Leadbettera azotonutricia ZAS-9]
MFKFCPACGSTKIIFKDNRVFKCPDCGFTYYHNTAAATGCVVSTPNGVILLVRGKEPSRGKLALPGGFVDPGEGALEGLRRELQEEIGWTPPPGTEIELFASFPNIYPYKNIVYNTCDLFFTIHAPDLTAADLRPEAGEIEDIRFLRPDEVKPEDLAFDSTRRAMAAYLKRV